MIVICEECGKKYRIDPEKIRGQEAKFTCKTCSHEIVVQKPMEQPAARTPEPDTSQAPPAAGDLTPHNPAVKKKPFFGEKRITLGLRGKMILLFFLLPGMISGLAAYLTMHQISRTADHVVEASRASIQHMAEISLLSESKSITERVSAFLMNNPQLSSQDIAENPRLKALAAEKISWGGTISLYALPDGSGTWTTVVHTDPQLAGTDVQAMKKPLGKGFPSFWKLATAVEKNDVSRGYFTIGEAGGKTKEVYMVARRITGTPYALAFIAPVDQMLNTASQLQEVAKDSVYTARFFTSAIMFFAFLLIGIVVTAFGHRLTGRIRKLTDASDKISVGDLDTKISVTSNDEIGELAEAISRMQDSLNLSIQRLRRRR